MLLTLFEFLEINRKAGLARNPRTVVITLWSANLFDFMIKITFF